MALVLAAAALVAVDTGSESPEADAAVLAPGFNLTTVFSGLTLPTSFRFAPDGHVFVAEKDGVVKSFDGLNDTTASVFADLRPQVYSFVDRGLLSLAVDPQFPTRPYVYVLYTYDHVLGDPAPAPKWNDNCAGTGSGVDNGNCTASARLSRLTADPTDLGKMIPGSEKVLVEDWCQQFPIHINGTVAFGKDGALYASHGSSGAAHFTDYGQTGTPVNPCGDPPVPVGGVQTIPTAEGGSLRSQDPRTPGDPYTLDGTLILGVDPDTGAGLPGNPLFTSTDVNARRIVAYGFRMPFRFAPRPGANEMWVGDVGEDLLEEVDRVPIGGPLVNSGWPCYEADRVNSGYAPLNICANLVAQGPSAILPPFWEYTHGQPAFTGDTCATGSLSISGLAFYPGGNYPPRYDGAMFMADYARRCVWAMLPGADGLPDPTKVENLVSDVRGTTDLQIGPGGDLYMNDLIGGSIARLSYSGANRTPEPAITADRTNGPAPLTVKFDARSSVDPDGDVLRYEWDLDGDGAFDYSTSATPQRTYAAGVTDVRLRAVDPAGLAGTVTQRITSGNTQPAITILSPAPTLRWSVGDEISFSATATDPDDGVLPASAFDWRLTIQHCPGSCHDHPTGHFEGVRSGSFETEGHEFPSFLELTLTVTDSGGLTTSTTISLFPNVSTVSVNSDPPGLKIDARGQSVTPFTRSLITGDRMSVSAADQNFSFVPVEWDAWSDGGAESHDIVVNSDRTLTATFSPRLLSVPDRVVSEEAGASTAAIPVVLNKPSRKTVTVHWNVQPWTAGTNDITGGSGTLTIPAGAGRATIPVPIKPDTLVEGMEWFAVTIDSPTNALVLDNLAIVQLLDNDNAPPYVYISRFQSQWDAPMAKAVAQLGVPVQEMPRMGAVLLRFLAAIQGGVVGPLTPAPAGDYEYATTYTSTADRDAIVADAAKYGINGTQLHTIGAQLLTYLVLLDG